MKTFIEDLKNKLMEAEAIRCDEDFIVHLFGEKADEETEEDKAAFIKATNAKYFNSDSEKLLGNFLELRIQPERSFIRVNLNDAYDDYHSNGLDGVVNKMLSDFGYSQRVHSSAEDVINSIYDYEAIKDKLIIRPLHFDSNKATLDGYMYTKLGDMALCLYAIVLDDVEKCALNTIKIPEAAAMLWGPDKQTIMNNALENTERLAPARLYENILEIPAVEMDDTADPLKMKHSIVENCIPLLTTTRKTNGAIAAFYPRVLRKISELLCGDFYIAFTSIHECMIHKVGTFDAASIKKHIRATNHTFGMDEALTNEVYIYRAGILTQV